MFLAKYPGTCHACKGPIEEGDPIEMWPVHAGPKRTYRHIQPCPDTLDDKPTKWDGTSLEDMGY